MGGKQSKEEGKEDEDEEEEEERVVPLFFCLRFLLERAEELLA